MRSALMLSQDPHSLINYLINRYVCIYILALFLLCLPLSAQEKTRPVRGIVFILIDDLGVMDVAVNGSTYYKTPNIDRLAAGAMRFTNAYCASPVCSPTRASILTGRYPHRLHLTTYIPGASRPHARLRDPDWIKYLRKSEYCYAEAFRDAGWQTAHIGKWHVGGKPQEFGFKTVVDQRSEKNMQDPWYIDYYTQNAETFLEKNCKKKFIMTLSHGTVHVPLYEKPQLIAKYEKLPPGENGQHNPVMAAMIERMDASVGRVLNKIDELGIAQSTAVIFYSDNGGLSSATSNKPYRGGKSQLYEGGIRVPLIVRWPGVTAANSICQERVTSCDLYPTFLSMAGLPQRPEQHLDGLSWEPLLSGNGRLKRNALYWHQPHYQTLGPHAAMISGRWKLVQHYDPEQTELYDLSTDISEQHNIADKHPDITAAYKAQLLAHQHAIGAQFAKINPDYDPEKVKTNIHRAAFDRFLKQQNKDPRRYVEDIDHDYGAKWTWPEKN